jgi:hypothetical protein
LTHRNTLGSITGKTNHEGEEGYYVSTVGKYGNEETITNYVKAPGKGNDNKQLYKTRDDENQSSLFD